MKYKNNNYKKWISIITLTDLVSITLIVVLLNPSFIGFSNSSLIFLIISRTLSIVAFLYVLFTFVIFLQIPFYVEIDSQALFIRYVIRKRLIPLKSIENIENVNNISIIIYYCSRGFNLKWADNEIYRKIIYEYLKYNGKELEKNDMTNWFNY